MVTTFPWRSSGTFAGGTRCLVMAVFFRVGLTVKVNEMNEVRSLIPGT